MNKDYYDININSSNWKKIVIEYLDSFITLKVPPTCDVLQMKKIPSLQNVQDKIEYAFEHPIQSETIEAIVKAQKKPVNKLTVAIAVSDNTRPVPYNCNQDENILSPILYRLTRAGIQRRNIKIIIGTGTHTPTSDAWKKNTFGEELCNNYHIIDHNCYNIDLISIGNIKGVPVKINRDFFQSDLHIVTGLVETHFMAGASGGRKAICPGLVNIEATQVFHGPEYMANTNADSLIFNNNPCHEFALEVARKVRVDFTVNVLLDGELRICGITTGELEASHKKAIQQLRKFCELHIEKKYDIVLTHGSKVAVNHYQAIKGAWAALPAVKKGGKIILFAHNQDEEPIGSKYYRDLLKKFQEVGVGNYYPLLISPEWTFTHDQWEVQKWEQVFTRIGGIENLIYCTVNIPPDILATLPGISGYQFIRGSVPDITEMLQKAIYYCVSQKENPSMSFLKEGPYLVLKNRT
jgi:nickel-dependent lactate racemase